MVSRDRSRTLLLAAALAAALTLGVFTLFGLAAERASERARREETARAALEAAAARSASRIEAELREALQRVRDAQAAGALERLTPDELGAVHVVLAGADGAPLWPPRATWLELDGALERASFAVREVLERTGSARAEEPAPEELLASVAGWEKPCGERALARFRLAQRDGDWSRLDGADLEHLPSAAGFYVHAARARDALQRGKSENARVALHALEAFLAPLRTTAPVSIETWRRELYAELEPLQPGLGAAQEKLAAAWERRTTWIKVHAQGLASALARATGRGRFEALEAGALPSFSLAWNTPGKELRAIASLEERAQQQVLDALARELAPRCTELRLIDGAAAGAVRAPELVASFPGLGLEPLLAARWREEAAFPWRTVVAGSFLAACLALALLGLAFASRSVRAERAAVAERSEFLSRVSHQLKTPVANLRLFAETLASGRAREPEDVQKMQAILGSEAERLGEYLQRVLSLARLDESTEASATETIDLLALLEIERARAALLAARAGVRFEQEWPAAVPALRGDARALADALANVVENAVRFSRVGGHVRLEAEVLPQELRVRVRDEGPGIPSSEHERIFERFAQLGGERRAAGEGTGLGLWIAREGARRSGGTLVVERSDASGTSFLFRWPLPME
ncbi:MAG: HAMP domain-containing histidine kinase [Planctomycetes bacterium]|nr:HAMP domain-containing histidine kinase [Planctomycetota bacterium]